MVRLWFKFTYCFVVFPKTLDLVPMFVELSTTVAMASFFRVVFLKTFVSYKIPKMPNIIFLWIFQVVKSMII